MASSWHLLRDVLLTARQGSVLDAEEGIRFRGKTVQADAATTPESFR